MSSNIRIPKNCEFCGKRFIAQQLKTRYCSHTCNSRHYKSLQREKKIEQVLSAPVPEASISPVANIASKPFLSIDETAMLLGASRRTIHRLIADGKLKVGKVGARTIIQRTAIDNLFQ